MNKVIRLGAIAIAWGCVFGSPAAAQQQSVSRDWFVGTWSDRADCGAPVHFMPNGKFIIPSGAEGEWRLERDAIVLINVSTRAEQRRSVQRIDQNTLRSDGVVSYRCQGRSR